MKNNSKEVILTFNLPDFSRKDINIRLSNKSVVIKAKKKSQNKVQKKDFYHKEISQRVFSYATTLPAIDSKKAKISFNKGVLKIIIPKV